MTTFVKELEPELLRAGGSREYDLTKTDAASRMLRDARPDVIIHLDDMVRSFLFAIDRYGDLVEDVWNAGHEDLNLSKAEVARKVRERREFFLYFSVPVRASHVQLAEERLKAHRRSPGDRS